MGDTLTPEYLAGLFDGEGCFRFNHTPTVEMCMSYPEILRDIQEEYGGNLTTCPPTRLTRKALYRWYVVGPSAIRLVEDVLPYLREKAPQAFLLRKVLRYPPKTAMRHASLRELKALKRISYRWLPPQSVASTQRN